MDICPDVFKDIYDQVFFVLWWEMTFFHLHDIPFACIFYCRVCWGMYCLYLHLCLLSFLKGSLGNKLFWYGKTRYFSPFSSLKESLEWWTFLICMFTGFLYLNLHVCLLSSSPRLLGRWTFWYICLSSFLTTGIFRITHFLIRLNTEKIISFRKYEGDDSNPYDG